MREYILEARNIKKNFGGVKALKNAQFDLYPGEIHALVGENGAGKSTFINIIGGVFEKTEGLIEYKGHDVNFTTPMDSINAGIAIIHQELSLMPDLNIIENIYMGRMEVSYGRVLWKEQERLTREQLKRIGLEIDPYTKVGTLPKSYQQMIEIAKALSKDVKIVIMDEPNSSLTETESEKLFKLIDELKSDGVAVIYVSHKLEEVLRLSDRITAFRDGEYVDTILREEASVDKIINLMVGRDLEELQKRQSHATSEVVLSVKNLTSDKFKNVSFDLHKGEILGFSGLVGAGRSEVMSAVFGADRFRCGEIIYQGESVEFTSPFSAIKAGIGMLSEDRKGGSILPELPIWLNQAIAYLPWFCKKGRLDFKGIHSANNYYKEKMRTKLNSFYDPITSLSGGNQQKVILSRWLEINPTVLILDEPTHGVDVGAKAEIYHLIHSLTEQGMSLILISSEMPEIIGMSDRVAVMHEGTITGILEQDEICEERIMTLAAGYDEASA